MDARGYRRSGTRSARASATTPRPPHRPRSSALAFTVLDHTALRRPVELRPSSPGHKPPDPARSPDTPHKTHPGPSPEPPPTPSTPGDPPAANPSTTAATTSPAHDHTHSSS